MEHVICASTQTPAQTPAQTHAHVWPLRRGGAKGYGYHGRFWGPSTVSVHKNLLCYASTPPPSQKILQRIPYFPSRGPEYFAVVRTMKRRSCAQEGCRNLTRGITNWLKCGALQRPAPVAMVTHEALYLPFRFSFCSPPRSPERDLEPLCNTEDSLLFSLLR